MQRLVSPPLWHMRFDAAAWLFPVMLTGLFILYLIIPLAEKTLQIQNTIATGEQNTYQTSWLDSVSRSLENNLKSLQEDIGQLSSRTITFSTGQTHTDSIRQIFTKSDLDVIKIQTLAEKTGGLIALKTDVSGKASFRKLKEFLANLFKEHPALFIETMMVRRTKQKLYFRIALLAYAFNNQPEKIRGEN